MLISPNHSELVGLQTPAAKSTVTPMEAEEASLSQAREAQIRERLSCGAYDMVEVADAVARRLLDSGDL
jgi:hypothetical protein